MGQRLLLELKLQLPRELAPLLQHFLQLLMLLLLEPRGLEPVVVLCVDVVPLRILTHLRSYRLLPSIRNGGALVL